MQGNGFTLDKILSVNSLCTAYDDIKRFDFFFSGEQHDFWEFVYVASGTVGATADNRVYELSSGQVIFHKPMEFHKLWSTGGTEPHVIIMSFDASGPGMKNFENSIFLMPQTASKQLFEIFEEIEHLFERSSNLSLKLKDNLDDYSLNLLAIHMEMLLLEILKGKKQKVSEDEHAGAETYRTIIDMMNDNINKNLTITDFANLCGISESYLKKIFTKYSGSGPAKYFLRLKISRACTMLLNGATVAQVSKHLEFANQQYFSTVFKRETGYSPTVYKKRILVDGNKETRR